MDASKLIGFGGRAAGAWYAYRRFGAAVPGGPVVAAVLGWLAAGIIIDHALPRD